MALDTDHNATGIACYTSETPNWYQACRKTGIPVVTAAWAETAAKEVLLKHQPDEILTPTLHTHTLTTPNARPDTPAPSREGFHDGKMASVAW